MFKYYGEICDVVSLLAYCPVDRSYLLTKSTSGELWLPSLKVEKNCWKTTALKITFEIFGVDSGICSPIRIFKIWTPSHALPCVYHAVFKVPIKLDFKKKNKVKQGLRLRLQWYNAVELERQRAHQSLRSPELVAFALAVSEQALGKDIEGLLQDMENEMLTEICEDSVIIGSDVAGGAAALVTPNFQLLEAAGYTRDEQIRIYREFLLMVFPAMYMSQHVFMQFMLEVGWDRTQCPSLFRAADVTGRGGLSFQELMLWVAALEPNTQHSGIAAEIRCRYIFRYFDSNRDLKLEYEEFKELIAASRAARQLSIDPLSVAKDSDLCLRQLGLQPPTPLQLADFLRGVGELRIRGTSSLLRSSRSIAGYLMDLQEREKHLDTPSSSKKPSTQLSQTQALPDTPPIDLSHLSSSGPVTSGSRRKVLPPRPDYSMAVYTMKVHRKSPIEMFELRNFDEDAVSSSTARLITGAALSLEVLGPAVLPVEALAAVHYFAKPMVETTIQRHGSPGSMACKSAWAWRTANEEVALGALLLKLSEAVLPICANEPRLLRLAAPVYIIGDLHGNLSSLLSMESALWPAGSALAPARILFLGDYVDRGPHGTELMAYLLSAKLQRPNGVFLIRGNHETRDIQKMFTFYTECVTKYGDSEGCRIWSAINNVFDVLPLAAVVDDKVFCCHGGIPPPWVCPLITAIDKVPTPLPRPAEQSSIAWELLWNDPVKQTKITATLALELAANEGFAANAKRGTGHVFDQAALDRFLLANQLSHVVRAHEVYQNGFMCQLRGRLVSVFSSSHYCGGNNDSGLALLEGGKLRLIRINDD